MVCRFCSCNAGPPLHQPPGLTKIEKLPHHKSLVLRLFGISVQQSRHCGPFLQGKFWTNCYLLQLFGKCNWGVALCTNLTRPACRLHTWLLRSFWISSRRAFDRLSFAFRPSMLCSERNGGYASHIAKTRGCLCKMQEWSRTISKAFAMKSLRFSCVESQFVAVAPFKLIETHEPKKGL